jgi:polar amino acid transport system substrate-binding protein
MIKISRRRMLQVSALGAVCASGLGGTAMGEEGDLLAEIKKRGYLRMGTFSIPPECWIDIDSGEWRGIDADFAKPIAKEIGVDIDAVVIVHAALAPSLESGRLDVIAGLYRTPEREKVMAYNNVPTWYGVDVLVARKDNAGISSFADLKGKSLGVVRGSAQEGEAVQLQKNFGVSDIRKYDAADPMLLDVKSGRVDAGIWWGFTFDYAVRKNPSYELKVVQYMPPSYLGSDTLPATYYVFSKRGTKSLIDAFDQGTKRLHATGEDKTIMARYGLTDPGYLTGKAKG